MTGTRYRPDPRNTMTDFATRNGFVEPRFEIQDRELDKVTRKDIWNITYAVWTNLNDEGAGYEIAKTFSRAVWTEFFDQLLDEYQNQGQSITKVKHVILDWAAPSWHALSLLAFIVENDYFDYHAALYEESLNEIFVKHLVGWRFIDGQLVRLDSELEVAAVSEAMEDTRGETAFEGSRHHLKQAVSKLSDLENPDYPNSVKESISAVEAMVEHITGEGVLSKGLKKLSAAGIDVHPALLTGWDKLYGWTSDEGGVRHSTKVIPNVDQATARFMLVSCAGFVTFLIDRSRQVN